MRLPPPSRRHEQAHALPGLLGVIATLGLLISLAAVRPAGAPHGTPHAPQVSQLQVSQLQVSASQKLARMLSVNCGGCHVRGSVGAPDFTAPGTLAALGHLAAQSVREKQMPPWPPAEHEGRRNTVPLAGQLPPAERAELADALDRATLSGLNRVASALTRPPAWQSRAGETRGLPVALPGLSSVPATSMNTGGVTPDPHVCAALPARPGWISGLNVTPLSGLHHLIVLRLPAGMNAPNTPWRCDGDVGLSGTAAVGSWVLGAERLDPHFALGTGVQLHPGDQLVVQAHLHRMPGMSTPASPGTLSLLYSPAPLKAVVQLGVAAPIDVPCRAGARCQPPVPATPGEHIANYRLTRDCGSGKVIGREWRGHFKISAPYYAKEGQHSAALKSRLAEIGSSRFPSCCTLKLV